MESLIRARGLCKKYGAASALEHVDLDITPGRIVGLIGPNGAGKTTLLKALLGLTQVTGELSVLGLCPKKDRARLLEQVSFIADTAILPRWLQVRDALDFMAAVHPRFKRERAEVFLARTSIPPASRVGTLSKGMVTQLHLALVMAIDSRLLVLDEPTLGLDILYRKQFYATLLEDYFDAEKTIVITTHQVEEIENLLTDVVFIRRGRIDLACATDQLENSYTELQVDKAQLDAALALCPIHSRALLGGKALIYENVPRRQLAALGAVKTPGLADLFVAKMEQGSMPA